MICPYEQIRETFSYRRDFVDGSCREKNYQPSDCIEKECPFWGEDKCRKVERELGR